MLLCNTIVMWVIKGSYSDYGDCRYCGTKETILCSFDSEEEAHAYLKAAELVQPKWRKKYCQASLLAMYDSCWVDWEDDFAHNPEIDWRK